MSVSLGEINLILLDGKGFIISEKMSHPFTGLLLAITLDPTNQLVVMISILNIWNGHQVSSHIDWIIVPLSIASGFVKCSPFKANQQQLW